MKYWNQGWWWWLPQVDGILVVDDILEFSLFCPHFDLVSMTLQGCLCPRLNPVGNDLPLLVLTQSTFCRIRIFVCTYIYIDILHLHISAYILIDLDLHRSVYTYLCADSFISSRSFADVLWRVFFWGIGVTAGTVAIVPWAFPEAIRWIASTGSYPVKTFLSTYPESAR